MTDKLDKVTKTALELNLPTDPRWANLAEKKHRRYSYCNRFLLRNPD